MFIVMDLNSAYIVMRERKLVKADQEAMDFSELMLKLMQNGKLIT